MGRTHLLLCLSNLTIDNASLSRRSTVPNLSRDSSKFLGAHYASSIYFGGGGRRGTFSLIVSNVVYVVRLVCVCVLYLTYDSSLFCFALVYSPSTFLCFPLIEIDCAHAKRVPEG